MNAPTTPTSFFSYVRDGSVLHDHLGWFAHGLEYLVVAIDTLGCVILLIASDIVHTALSLAMADLVFLGLLVIIRSLISYFLDRELEQVKRELAE